MPSSSRRAHRWAGTPRAAKVGGMDGSLVERSRDGSRVAVSSHSSTRPASGCWRRSTVPAAVPRSPPLGSGAMEPVMARKMWRTLEPYHGLIYFAPEATAAYEALGVMGFDGYFASRAAPMGAVPAEVVIATFFNFNPAIVHHAIPAAWERDHAGGAPRRAPRRRVGRALRRAAGDLLDDPSVARAAELARIAADGVHGRRSTALRRPRRPCRGPTTRALALWHAITLLREFRGDGHIACLVEAGLDGIDALVLPRCIRRRAPRRAPGRRGSGTTRRGMRRWRASRDAGLRRRRRRLHRGRCRPPPAHRGPHRRPGPRARGRPSGRRAATSSVAWSGRSARRSSRAAPSGSRCCTARNYRGVTSMRMAVLRFSYGTMGSGKSTLALQIHHNLSSRGLRGLLCTQLDRDGAVVSSRLGVSAAAVDVGPKLDLFELASQYAEANGGLDYLVCDEAQFYTPAQVEQLGRVRRRAQRRRARLRAAHRLPRQALRGLGPLPRAGRRAPGAPGGGALLVRCPGHPERPPRQRPAGLRRRGRRGGRHRRRRRGRLRAALPPPLAARRDRPGRRSRRAAALVDDATLND